MYNTIEKYIGYILFICCFPLNAINKFLFYNYEISFPLQSQIYFICFVYMISKLLKKKKSINLNRIFSILLFSIVVVAFFSSYNNVSDMGVIKLGEYQNARYINSVEYYWDFFNEPILMYFVYIIIAFEFNNIIKITYENNIVKNNNIFLLIIIGMLILLTGIKNKSGYLDTVFLPDIDNGFYLQIGDYLAVFFLYFLFTSNKKYLYSVLSIMLLYKIGSRTSLYVMVLTLIICQFSFIKTRNLVKKTYIIIFIILIGSLISFLLLNLLSKIDLDTRMINILFDKGIDGSYQSRNYIEQVALKDIKNIWMTAYLFREVYLFGNGGLYVHNIISFWISYGIIPFIILISLITYNCKKIIFSMKYINELNYALISIFIFLLIESIISRSYYYPYIWFCTYLQLNNYKKIKGEYDGQENNSKFSL